MEETIVKKRKEKQKALQVPEQLVRETIDGIPLYYRGYRDVLNKKIQPEQIMGSSTLQSKLISYLLKLLLRSDAVEKNYEILTNEIGSHIRKGTNFAHDIAIFDKKVLTPDKIDDHYSRVPAKIIIEIDIRTEAQGTTEQELIKIKTDKVLQFGTEKMFWVFTKAKQVLVAEPNKDWLLMDWNKTIHLMDDVGFNIGEYLKKEGIK